MKRKPKPIDLYFWNQCKWCFEVENLYPRDEQKKIQFVPQSEDVRKIFTIRLQYFLDITPELSDEQIVSIMADMYIDKFFRAVVTLDYPLSDN